MSFVQKKKKTVLNKQTEVIVRNYLFQSLEQGIFDRPIENAVRAWKMGWNTIIKMEFTRDAHKISIDVRTTSVQPWVEEKQIPGVEKDTVVFGFINSKNHKEGYFIGIPIKSLIKPPSETAGTEKKEFTFKCNNCPKMMKDPKYCSKCNFVSYCSRECQVAQWKIHKVWCEKYTSKQKPISTPVNEPQPQPQIDIRS